MRGSSFCSGAKEATCLLYRNPVKIGIVSGIGEFFEIIGNLSICLLTTMICYLIITNTEYYTTRLNSPVLPTLVT